METETDQLLSGSAAADSTPAIDLNSATLEQDLAALPFPQYIRELEKLFFGEKKNVLVLLIPVGVIVIYLFINQRSTFIPSRINSQLY